MAAAVLLTACGSSGPQATGGGNAGLSCDPGNPATSGACGSVVVALTDAEGDFTSYTVDVLSLSLERADGSEVELLPATARIDFAQLTSLTELLSTTTVVPGEFVRGHIRIDYSDAEIYVEAGDDIIPARVFDSNNVELTTDTDASIVDVEITLASSDRLLVTRGTIAFLSLDFDLAASHIVDTTSNPATVVASPYLVAETRPIDTKEIRVRGALVDVDLAASSYRIRMRPWQQRSGDFGIFTVHTGNTTEFEVDGEVLVGQDGLTALAAEPARTLTVAYGTLNLLNRRFDAEIVHAGDSVGGDRFSAVLGNIVSRSGDRLVLKGAIAMRNDRRAHFHRTIVVDIGPETKVTKIRHTDEAFDKDDLSVGQRVVVFGQFANPELDVTNRFGPDIALVLDATEGRARMLVTQLTGALVAAEPGRIEVKLRAIDRLSASMFDFSGTGITADTDADPQAYEIATSTLPLDALAVDQPVRVLGFVAAFGTAPPDFEGRTLIGPRDLPAVLGVGWGADGTTAPFSVMGPTSLVIDLSNPDIDVRHHLLIGDRLLDLYDLPASPSIEPSGLPRVYGIWEPGHIELFKDFGDFVDELALRLSNTDRARSLAAYGSYDEFDNALAARKVVVHMLPAD